MIKASVGHEFVHQEAFGAFNAATEKLHNVLVIDPADQVHLVEELIGPLPRVEEESFNCNGSPIGENSLEHRTGPTLA